MLDERVMARLKALEDQVEALKATLDRIHDATTTTHSATTKGDTDAGSS